MLGSGVLDTAIGLVFVFLLLSLICAAVNELIARFLSMRPKMLESAIRNMLGSGQSGLSEQFYNHPMIKSISEPHGDSAHKPSYIAAQTFSSVLVDLLAKTEAATPLKNARTAIAGMSDGAEKKLLQLASDTSVDLQQTRTNAARIASAAATVLDQLAPAGTSLSLDSLKANLDQLPPGPVKDLLAHLVATSHDVAELRTAVNNLAGAPAQTLREAFMPADAGKGPMTLAGLREAVSGMSNNPVQQPVLALLERADGDMTKARQEIEHWYNDVMDRVSGWYKRRLQIVTLIVGLVIVLVTNADTIGIAKGVYRQPILRDSLSAVAAQALTRQPPVNADIAVESIAQYAQGATLPLGWYGVNGGLLSPGDMIASISIEKLIGFLLTVVAISLGAPFWFEMLKNVMRVAGGKPSASGSG